MKVGLKDGQEGRHEPTGGSGLSGLLNRAVAPGGLLRGNAIAGQRGASLTNFDIEDLSCLSRGFLSFDDFVNVDPIY
jgi:hypothetical protein